MISTNELKKLTHKHNEDSVFIESVSLVSANSFDATFKTIEDHSLYNNFAPTKNYLDPTYLLECARQVETIISHKYFNIAPSTKFLLKSWSLHYKKTPTKQAKFLKAEVATKKPINKKAKDNIFFITIKSRSNIVCEISISVSYIKNGTYHLIREMCKTHKERNRTYSEKCILPADVGYTLQENVCLSKFHKEEGKAFSEIHIPESNITYNDHPQDHITGMNITEAVKQTCYCYLKKSKKVDIEEFIITNIKGDFITYSENNLPTFIEIADPLERNESISFLLKVTQQEKVRAHFECTLEKIHEKN